MIGSLLMNLDSETSAVKAQRARYSGLLVIQANRYAVGNKNTTGSLHALCVPVVNPSPLIPCCLRHALQTATSWYNILCCRQINTPTLSTWQGAIKKPAFRRVKKQVIERMPD